MERRSSSRAVYSMQLVTGRSNREVMQGLMQELLCFCQSLRFQKTKTRLKRILVLLQAMRPFGKRSRLEIMKLIGRYSH